MTDHTHHKMEPFSPEFAQFWQDAGLGHRSDSPAAAASDESAAASQREALEALADRVSAARSIV